MSFGTMEMSEPITCPNASDEYQEVRRKVAGEPVLTNRVGEVETHDVSTRSRVVLRDGKLALKLSAECECGWSKTAVIRRPQVQEE